MRATSSGQRICILSSIALNYRSLHDCNDAHRQLATHSPTYNKAVGDTKNCSVWTAGGLSNRRLPHVRLGQLPAAAAAAAVERFRKLPRRELTKPHDHLRGRKRPTHTCAFRRTEGLMDGRRDVRTRPTHREHRRNPPIE
jgi:hypothetical protein